MIFFKISVAEKVLGMQVLKKFLSILSNLRNLTLFTVHKLTKDRELQKTKILSLTLPNMLSVKNFLNFIILDRTI